MFCRENLTKSILVSGPPETSKSFIFEAAIHWAEKGRRVVYITQSPLESLPSTYHDRNKLSPGAFKLMRFMYLPNYESLVEQLVDLHTFAVLPSVLLVDDLDAYICDPAVKEQPEVHIARLCAFVHDTANACARILKTPVHLCVSMSTRSLAKCPCAATYFDDHWNLRVVDSQEANNRSFELSRCGRDSTSLCTDEAREVFRFQNFDDRTILLKQIYEKIGKF